MEFPRWMYRQDVEKGRLFSTAKELDNAGEGWFDSPAFLHQEPVDDSTGSTEPISTNYPIEIPDGALTHDEEFDKPAKRKPGRPRKVTDANLHTA